MPYSEVEQRLPRLLREFGPGRAQANANYPFWRLQTDGIWTVRDAEEFTRNTSGDVSVGQLRREHAEAGFNDEAYRLLKQQPGLSGDDWICPRLTLPWLLVRPNRCLLFPYLDLT